MIALAAALAAVLSPVDAKRIEKMAGGAERIATCATAAACDGRWTRAVRWVRDNCRRGVAVDTPDRVATFPSTYPEVDTAFLVERRADGIWFAARCSNVFACSPPIAGAKAALAQALADVVP